MGRKKRIINLTKVKSSSSSNTKNNSSTERFSFGSKPKSPEKRVLPTDNADDTTNNNDRNGSTKDFISLTQNSSTSKILENNDNYDTNEEEFVPWMKSGGYTNRNVFLRLHEEIINFVRFVSPTTEEIQHRADFVEQMKTVINNLWPETQLEVFGSQETKMYLPTSDIDLVVFGASDGTEKLFQLADALREQELVDFIEVVDKARIPIVKFIDKKTQLHADVCFDVVGGLETAELVNQYIIEYPPFRPLVLLLKYFLFQRQLSETYNGGIGSFLLQIMVVSFLQHYAKLNQHQFVHGNMLNLGHLLLGFLELYGIQFNYHDIGISTLDSGEYFTKSSRYWFDPSRPYLLSVENPNEPELDIGKNSYEIRRIKKSFEHACYALKAEIFIHGQHKNHNKSILSHVIHVDDELLKRKGPSSFGFPLVDPIKARERMQKKDRKKSSNQMWSTNDILGLDGELDTPRYGHSGKRRRLAGNGPPPPSPPRRRGKKSHYMKFIQ